VVIVYFSTTFFWILFSSLTIFFTLSGSSNGIQLLLRLQLGRGG
jgi:hypothetical protein